MAAHLTKTHMLLVALVCLLATTVPAGSGSAALPSPGESSPEQALLSETCDGYDNNGDGIVDEGCSCEPGQAQVCFPGAPGTDLGTCAGGSQQCSSAGRWGSCSGAVLPAEDICGDGIDSDCDGFDFACAVDNPSLTSL